MLILYAPTTFQNEDPVRNRHRHDPVKKSFFKTQILYATDIFLVTVPRLCTQFSFKNADPVRDRHRHDPAAAGAQAGLCGRRERDGIWFFVSQVARTKE